MPYQYIIQTISGFLFAGGLLVLWKMKKRGISFSRQVLSGMALGLIAGAFVQFTVSPEQALQITDWTDIIGSGYSSLLQVAVIPLVFISITGAIIKQNNQGTNFGKKIFIILSILIGTAVIATLTGIATANAFSLSADGFYAGEAEIARGAQLESTNAILNNSSYAKKILEFIPKNIFLDFTGARSTSTIAVVIFSAILGISALELKKSRPNAFESFKNGIKTADAVIMELVKYILRLTPYGVMAMMFKIASTSSIEKIAQLGTFIIASYTAIAIMFAIHLIILILSGINPIKYIKQVFPVLMFAFSSRSIAATLPLNTETQISKLNVPKGIANLSASLGTTIGQNGCAAIYPAMLAVMIAPTMGVDPTSISFIIELVVIVAVSSFGAAGVGGGATVAALIVLSNMNFPVALAGLLISVEPLIDMSRTALNVNGAMLTGVISSKIIKEEDTDDETSENNEISVMSLKSYIENNEEDNGSSLCSL